MVPPPGEALNPGSGFFVSPRLGEEFQEAEPFRHVVISDFLHQDFAAQLREELIHKLDVKYRETDLFKFHQTKDISAILAAEKESPKLPYLAKLVERLYSEDFRGELARKFQLGELAARVDMAAQAYTEGCHLLCHDDVISTRKLTFVLYLADPEEERWRAEEGGGMEMYSEASAIPVYEILPDFNVALFFAVEPGKSFHAVREVTGQRTRLSLQGWFHAPRLEDTFGYERRGEASLQQVLARSEAALGPPASSVVSGKKEELGVEELRAVLGPWVHPQYLEDAPLEQLQTHFAENSEVQLSDFLLAERAEELLRLLRAADEAEEAASYGSGILDGWELHGPPHLQRYLVYAGQEGGAEGGQAPCAKRRRAAEGEGAAVAETKAGKAEEASPQRRLGQALGRVKEGLLLKAGFRALIQRVINLRLQGCEAAEVRRFRRGLDYSIATLRGLRGEPRIDVCLMVAECGRGQPGASTSSGGPPAKRRAARGEGPVQAGGDHSQQLWASEEVGGFESYIEVDEEEDDEKAEVYRDDDEEGPLLNIPVTHNALSIVMRDPGTLSFVKFVSRSAPSARCDVKLVFGIDPASLASDQEE